MKITPTPFQARVLSIPEHWSVALLGGRGGGKSHALCFLILRHLVKYGAAARVLVLRETYKGLEQLEQTMSMMLDQAFAGRVQHNRQEHVARIVDGGTVEFGQLESVRDLNKYIGRECTMLAIDEAGLLRDARWMTLLKSNLRSPEGVPLRTVLTGNPGGAQHAHLYKTHVSAQIPWHPYEVDGECFVYCPSTMHDNPHLDHADYERRLKTATGNDHELAAAYISGDWSALNRGAFYGAEWSPEHHIISQSKVPHITHVWNKRLAMDWGVSAPCVTLFGGTSPGDVPGIPKGTILIFDEISTHDPRDLSFNIGLGWPPSKVAEAILETCGKWNMHPHGVADDAVGLHGPTDTLIQYFQREHYINFSKPEKGRIQGWSLIRNRLQATKERTGKPGLIISDRCTYLLATLPIVMRDPKRPEDIDTAGPDHGADCLRYFVNTEPRIARWLTAAETIRKYPAAAGLVLGY